MLALLSIQLSWAAVAPYCEHEAAPAGHFGHHEHEHHAATGPDADDAEGTSGKSALAIDADCDQCHGSCAGLAHVPPPTITPIAAAHAGAEAAPSIRASALERPERPKWPRLA